MSRELKFTISCVSHDIRTPLTGAAGYLQLLENISDMDMQKNYLAIVRRRLEDLEGLLEELFLFTKLSMRSIKLNVRKLLRFLRCVMCWPDFIIS